MRGGDTRSSTDGAGVLSVKSLDLNANLTSGRLTLHFPHLCAGGPPPYTCLGRVGVEIGLHCVYFCAMV